MVENPFSAQCARERRAITAGRTVRTIEARGFRVEHGALVLDRDWPAA
jgi:hypothetical protein